MDEHFTLAGDIRDPLIVEAIGSAMNVLEPDGSLGQALPEQRDTSPEEEAFMPLVAVESMVRAALHDEPIKSRYDDVEIEAHIYGALTGAQDIRLSEGGRARIRHDKAALLEAGKERQYKIIQNDYQIGGGVIIESSQSPPPGSDGLLRYGTRIYTPVGVTGARLMAQIIQNGANFDYSKVFIPHDTPHGQEFRMDTPLTEVHTLAELESVVRALRAISATRPELLTPTPHGGLSRAPYPVGIPIPGVPGAFVGQVEDSTKQSFLAGVSKRWGHVIHRAIDEGIGRARPTSSYRVMPLPRGTVPNDAQIKGLAISARAQQMRRVKDHHQGVHPHYPSLLRDQDPDVIFQALGYRRT
jgi:hypothetical protein